MRLPFEHATGDHSKQLRACLYVVQNDRFQFEVVFLGGGMDYYQNFIYLSRKKLNQLKASKTPRGFYEP